jgi:hypothetical protein
MEWLVFVLGVAVVGLLIAAAAGNRDVALSAEARALVRRR